MAGSVYDRMALDADRLRREFDATEDAGRRASVLRALANIAHEFAVFAEGVDAFVEEKENETAESRGD